MTGKYPKDMTAAELLRWATNDEPNEYGNTTVLNKLFVALSGKPYSDTTFDEDELNIRALADKIDAEIEAARRDAVALKPMWWFWCAIKRGEDWPKPRDGEKFREYLGRCFILRPLDEKGEPVRFGDRDIDWESLGEYRGQGIQWDASAVDVRGHILATTADPYKIVAVAKTDGCGRVKRLAPEVLGADGLPIVVCETVWDTESGKELYVSAIVNADVGMIQCSDNDAVYEDYDARHLTHTPPDTQQRIDEDARKSTFEYWGCGDAGCGHCPAKIDGKTPAQRHNSPSCQIAKAIDLLRRQREIDASKGGE